MNIISNSCIGGQLYRCRKEEYKNPFIWCIVDNQSTINLIKNYDNINFLNYEIYKDMQWNFFINIDNKVKLSCVHYHFSPKDNEPRISGVHVYYNKIWKYIAEKYETRVNRMLKEKSQPIFVLGTIHKFEENFLTKKSIEQILNIQTDKKIIIVTEYDFNDCPKNVLLHKTKIKDDGKTSNLDLGKEIFNSFKHLF